MPPKGAKKKTPAKKPPTTPSPKPKSPTPPVQEQALTVPPTKDLQPSEELSISNTTVTTTTTTTVTEEVVEEKTSEMVASGADAAVDTEAVTVTSSVVVEELICSSEMKSGDFVMNEVDVKEVQEGSGDEEEPEEEVEGEEVAVKVATGNGDAADNEGGGSEGEDESGTDDEDDDEDDADLNSYLQLAPVKEKKKLTEVEIFVGGLNRQAVEEDLTKVFGEFGEIKAVRIVKHPVTQRSKGYAFISYATSEQARKVLTDLKDGVEVKGKRAGVSQSQDSDTLYMGNICKTWTKEQVLEALKGLGIEQIEELYLPEDPKSEGKIRGFAYLEFCNHSDAMAAFQRLRKPDAVFGRNRSAKVAFAPSMHPSEEALSQVKTVFIEGLPDSWGEEKLTQLCEQYGQVEKVQLSRDLVTVKRNDFGFVSFITRENAVACVEGINSAQIGEGDAKVQANLAKPKYKGRLGKKAARGGYRVQKDGEKVEEKEITKAKSGGKSKGAKGKGKAPPRRKSSGGGKKPQTSIAERQGTGAASKEKEQPAKSRKRDVRSTNSGPSGRPSKKPRGNERGRPSNGSGNRAKGSHSGNGRLGRPYERAPAVYADPYGRSYGASGSRYQGQAYAPVSDMAPHAGYYNSASASQGRDVYDYGMRRGGPYDTQAGRTASYVGGSAPPPSYAPAQSHYAAYESRGTGGYPYPSPAAYLRRRQYY